MTLRRTHEFRVARSHTGIGYVVSGVRIPMLTLEGYGTLVRMGPGLQVDNAGQDDRQFRGIEVRVAGAEADNATGALRLYRVTPYAASRATGSKGDAAVELIGTLAFTFGTGAGAATDGTTDQIGTSTKFADTFVWTPATTATTPKGVSDFVFGLYAGGASAQVYSPADNTCAVLGLPDIGGGDLFVDIEDAAGVFAIVKLWT